MLHTEIFDHIISFSGLDVMMEKQSLDAKRYGSWI